MRRDWPEYTYKRPFLHIEYGVRLRTAPLLLSLCYASSAVGLGFGELVVRSHLTQPLHATVKILDPEAFDADCFRVLPAEGGLSAPLRVRLDLERTGDSALLHLRTQRAISEPFVQFVLAFECGPNLRREYVALLDPPSAEPSSPLTEAAPPQVPTALPPSTSARPAPDRQRQAARATPARPAATRAQRPPSEDSPRLVLSGRRMASQASDAFALKLDTTLPDLERTRAPALTETELSDENTALTRKLAHLEAQLVELQQRNAELEARRVAVAAAAPEPPPGRAIWPLVLLGLALLAGLGGLVAWLRRRAQATRQQSASYEFPEDWTLPPRPEAGGLSESKTPPTPATSQVATPIESPPPPPRPVLEFAKPLQEEMTEVKDDILDQAEVYMAHGHSDLAIHLLQEHLREAPTESPVPWLLLLDLLHRDGDLDGYASATKECRTHFNINLADHPAANQPEQGEGLEAYPHLLERLTQMWRTPDVDDFFADLIYDHRGGTRMGFAPAAYREILLLRAISEDVREAA